MGGSELFGLIREERDGKRALKRQMFYLLAMAFYLLTIEENIRAYTSFQDLLDLFVVKTPENWFSNAVPFLRLYELVNFMWTRDLLTKHTMCTEYKHT